MKQADRKKMVSEGPRSEMMGCVSFSAEECFRVRVWLCHSRNASPAGSCLLSPLLCLCVLHTLLLPNLVNVLYLNEMSVSSLMIYSELKRSFFHGPPSSSLLLSSNLNFKPKETTRIWSDFHFCGRSFIAAKPTGRPLNSETQPDRCGRETLPAAMQVIHPQGTDRDELHRHIKSLESNFFYGAAC